jgi:hypothetical protein
MGCIVKVLLERETLEREEFEALMKGATCESVKAKPSPRPESVAPEGVTLTPDEIREKRPEQNPPLPEPGVA